MQTRQTFLVGLLSLIATGGLVGLLALFGELDGVFGSGYRVDIQTDNAGGTRRGSAVTLNGVAVGRIEAIELTSEAAYPVKLVATIDEGVTIPADASFAMEQPLIGGSSTIAIITAGAVGPALSTDGSGSLSGHYSSVLERLSAAFDSRLGPLMETMSSFREFAQTYTELGESLNEFIRPQAVGGPPTLSTTVGNLNRILLDVDEALQWLTDDAVKNNVLDAVTGANDFFDAATSAADEYEKLAVSLDGEAQAFLQRVAPVTDELAATLEQVNALMALAANGEGSMGLLLNDPDLYRSLTDAAARLEQTLKQIQLFVEKAKAEGLPVSF
ncbi:MAG: MlaD family protein [Planctomycetota bacterium]|jgi:phospholipid/cholesterol/gamma-HCH transport system substrate-binding protein